MSKCVLVACEESQAVTKEFRDRGVEAYSCDIIDCSGGHPEWHIKQDVLPLLSGNCTFKTCDGTSHTIEGKWDAIIAFPPCFVAGTKIMTKDGIKNIEDVVIGDYVLTHTGNYKKVYDVMSKTTNKICTVTAESASSITCTPNHRFYTNIVNRLHNDGTNQRVVSEDFTWLSPSEFDKYTSYNVDSNNKRTYNERVYLTSICDDIYETPEYDGVEVGGKIVNTLPINDSDFWYFIGRWVGDGNLYRKNINEDKKLYGAVLCDGKDKETEMDKLFATLKDKFGWNFYKHEEETVFKYDVYSKELALFLKDNFGEYSYSKSLPGFVTRLPKDLANAFLNGYLSADGYTNEKRTEFSTVSENLAYSLQYMFRKYRGVPCSIRKEDNRNVIEGRIVNVKQIFHCYYCNTENRKRYMTKDNYILYPHRKTTTTNNVTTVYNLSVEDDESYTANGFIVHNCTHLAVSGAPAFEGKRKDGRQRFGIDFFGKFLIADCDKVVIENPVNIISGDYVKTWFPDLCEEYNLPIKPTQRIHPWMFGDNHSKNTCLWIKGLPPLNPITTERPTIEWFEWVDSKTGKKKREDKLIHDAFIKSKTAEERQRIRSKTFPGIAKAMVEQWLPYI